MNEPTRRAKIERAEQYFADAQRYGALAGWTSVAKELHDSAVAQLLAALDWRSDK